MTSPEPIRVVITPDGLGRAIVDRQAALVLPAWRDGLVLPVVTRAMLLQYLRLLHRLGLAERQVRWWGWWLGSPVKALILTDESPPPSPGTEAQWWDLARRSGARWVIHGGAADEPRPPSWPTEGSPDWIAARHFDPLQSGASASSLETR